MSGRLKQFSPQILHFALTTLSGVIVLFVAASLSKRVLSENSMTSAQRKKLEKMLKKLNRELPPDLTEYEESTALQLVDPEDVDVSFKDIGGRGQLIKEIVRVTQLPFRMAELASKSSLISPSKGILLYGPPGTGKTMLARAVAKESGFVFINLNFSQVLNKYVGETEKRIEAVFSLARKLAPTLIFVDEIDCYFRVRSMGDHEFTSQMKANFMSQWDGFERQHRVMVMAASNRPDVIDPAILRRLPCKFEVGLPDLESRVAILKVILANEKVSTNVDYRSVGMATEGFSGDDLREMCKTAALNALMPLDAPEGEVDAPLSEHAITTAGLLVAATRVLPTGATIRDLPEYGGEASS